MIIYICQVCLTYQSITNLTRQSLMVLTITSLMALTQKSLVVLTIGKNHPVTIEKMILDITVEPFRKKCRMRRNNENDSENNVHC